MKRLLALILCLILCLSLFACNASEEPTEEPTEAPTESEETKATETDETVPKPERIKNIHFAESGKIDFPDKEILYIQYDIIRQISPIPSKPPYVRVGNTFIFEDPKVIKDIIDCFETSELRPASQPYFSDKDFYIYYTDNTYITFSMGNGFTVWYGCHSEGQEPVMYYYYISPEAHERLYAIIKF